MSARTLAVRLPRVSRQISDEVKLRVRSQNSDKLYGVRKWQRKAQRHFKWGEICWAVWKGLPQKIFSYWRWLKIVAWSPSPGSVCIFTVLTGRPWFFILVLSNSAANTLSLEQSFDQNDIGLGMQFLLLLCAVSINLWQENRVFLHHWHSTASCVGEAHYIWTCTAKLHYIQFFSFLSSSILFCLTFFFFGLGLTVVLTTICPHFPQPERSTFPDSLWRKK